MAITIQPGEQDALRKTVAKRLKAARRAAGLSEKDVAEALGHKGLTQVSLAERADPGGRMPPHVAMVCYAKLYAVPLDYLYGLIDDHIAEGFEVNQAAIANHVSESIQAGFDLFKQMIAQRSAIAIGGCNQDRIQLRIVCGLARQSKLALADVKRLNPEFDEDWRGSAKLDRLLNELIEVGNEADNRIAQEMDAMDALGREMVAVAVVPDAQFRLGLHQ